jgi:hypothetical protein
MSFGRQISNLLNSHRVERPSQIEARENMIDQFEADAIKNVTWDFANFCHWRREFLQVRDLDIRGSRDNLIRFATFFVKTLDYIIDTDHP